MDDILRIIARLSEIIFIFRILVCYDALSFEYPHLFIQ